MKAHEIARRLLDGPDFEVLVEGDGCYNRKPLSFGFRVAEDGEKIVFIETDDDDRSLQQDMTEEYDDYDDDGYDDDE